MIIMDIYQFQLPILFVSDFWKGWKELNDKMKHGNVTQTIRKKQEEKKLLSMILDLSASCFKIYLMHWDEHNRNP